MLLYHGSNVIVRKPILLRSDIKLDFGSGFYVTSSFDQAKRWADLTAKRRGNGAGCVTVYEFDGIATRNLSILEFENPSVQWLRFVSSNRKGISEPDQYDIVIGPVANDRTMPVISLYFAGIYDEDEAIKRLLPQKLKDQYAFKTEEALNALTCKEVISI